MKIDKEKLKLPNWEKYATNQLDFYADTERRDLMCRYKLIQIYQNFYIARMNILFSDEKNNYGDMLNIESKQNIQKIFIQNALLYYNFCIDLSWTMIYLYCMPKRSECNITSEEVKNAEKIVDYEFLVAYLNAQYKNLKVDFKNKIKLLLDIVKKFWIKILNDDFRQIYNYIKHQGAYDILDINPPIFMRVEGIEIDIDIIKSPEFDVDKITAMLIEFNNEYIEYLDKIIEIIIDSSNTKEFYNFEDLIKNMHKNRRKNNKQI